MSIHTRPSGSNDTTEMIRKGSIRNKQLNRQSILEHNHTVCGTASSHLSTRGRLVSHSTHGSTAVECRTRNQVSPGSNPPLLPFRNLGIFVLSIVVPVDSAV